jgi:hypothetical protein
VAIEQRVEGAWKRLATRRPNRRGRIAETLRPRATGDSVALRAHLRSRNRVSKTVRLRLGPRVRTGFNNNAVADKVASPDQAAGLLASVNADVDRVQIRWAHIEPSPGDYRFATYDRIYSADLARGVKPLFILAFAPTWANGGVCLDTVSNCHAAPTRNHYDDFARTAAAIAARYPRAAGIEIWNEPNTPYFWRPGPDPAGYAALLAASYNAIKAVAPSMRVTGGATASGGLSWGKIRDTDFLTAMYRSASGVKLDAISMHAYPDPGADVAANRVRAMMEVRDRLGDPSTPIWVTETGVSTTGTTGVSESSQAATLVDLTKKLGAIPDVKMVLFHTLVEPPRGVSNPDTGFGIVRQGLKPKRAFCALGVAWGSAGAC